MRPEEILEALRLAITSGAIQVHAYSGPYPHMELELYEDKGILGLSWCGAEVYFHPDGVEYERPL